MQRLGVLPCVLWLRAEVAPAKASAETSFSKMSACTACGDCARAVSARIRNPYNLRIILEQAKVNRQQNRDADSGGLGVYGLMEGESLTKGQQAEQGKRAAAGGHRLRQSDRSLRRGRL